MRDRVNLQSVPLSATKPHKLIHIHHVLIAGVFALMIVGLLVVANIGMDILTSMRAYVGGEGLWSKAQKDAVHYLLRYGKTRSEGDYGRYLDAILVPLADREARRAMQQARIDQREAGEAFIRGGNHPDDVAGMVSLFGRYHSQRQIAEAIRIWAEADRYLENLQHLGTAIHEELIRPSPDQVKIEELLARVDALNEQFPRLEDGFSRNLGDAARYARAVVFNVLLAGAMLALVLGLFVSYRLIVRAREADERYRHLFETASDAIFISDHDTGIILDANAKLAELTGISIARLPGTDQRSLFGREIPAVHGSSDLSAGDLVIKHVDGTSIPVDVRNNQSRFGSNPVRYSIVRDIRERRQMEDRLQEMARMESVGRLAGGVAHDFNNLLTVIAGYTQALKRITSGEAHDKVDQIRNAAERAALLVRQLLAFSRKQPLQPQPLDLNFVIRNMADMIRGVLGEPIDLILDLAPSVGSVEADPHQLEQIILNLSTNARDAMPEGGRLIIKTWSEAAGGETTQPTPHAGLAPASYIGLSITDNGQGMDAATQSRVFEPFFSTKPMGKGTGLGLATVYGTVKQSCGHIFVRSEIGQGASFTILLPCTKGAVTRDLKPEQVDRSRGSETILLVEDDSAVREVLEHGLEEEGYKVFTAANGHAALDFFLSRSVEIELIVTDLVMPGMGGIVLGERLREAGSTVPMIYASGYHQDLEKYSAEQLPLGQALLLKPFSPQALAIAIRQVLAVQTKVTSTAHSTPDAPVTPLPNKHGLP